MVLGISVATQAPTLHGLIDQAMIKHLLYMLGRLLRSPRLENWSSEEQKQLASIQIKADRSTIWVKTQRISVRYRVRSRQRVP
jgi:hypothetical protein